MPDSVSYACHRPWKNLVTSPVPTQLSFSVKPGRSGVTFPNSSGAPGAQTPPDTWSADTHLRLGWWPIPPPSSASDNDPVPVQQHEMLEAGRGLLDLQDRDDRPAEIEGEDIDRVERIVAGVEAEDRAAGGGDHLGDAGKSFVAAPTVSYS